MPPSRIDASVRESAVAFLRYALAEVRRQRLVPRFPRHSRWERYHGPWPEWWACWELARAPEAEPLVDALRAAYPARFGNTETKHPYKNPEDYVRGFLQAVIALTTIRSGRLTAKSPATTEMLAELHRLATMDGQEFGCLWLVEDIEFSAVSDEKIGDITLYRPWSPPEMAVSQLLPGAIWADDRGYPVPGAEHAALLWASRIGHDFHYDTTRTLNAEIGRVMHALHLATAATAFLHIVWQGETSMIHAQQPEAIPQPESFMRSRWRRVGDVTPGMLPGLRRLTAMIDRLDLGFKTKGSKSPSLAPVVIAMRRYAKTHRFASWQETVLDLSTALEACIGPRSKEQEIGLTLRTRAAHLLAHDDSEQADAIYQDVGDLYNLRSDIIHGNPRLKKDLPTLWSERGYTQVLEEDRLQVLLDRWRDIVRRAITARLMLADDSLGVPLWALIGDDAAVDRSLVRRDHRDQWRERILAGAASYGLPLLADPAPPLVDAIAARR